MEGIYRRNKGRNWECNTRKPRKELRFWNKKELSKKLEENRNGIETFQVSSINDCPFLHNLF